MVRNVFDVAQSFQVRAMRAAESGRENPFLGGRWPPTRDYTQAVVEWNESLHRTLQVMDSLDLVVVEHEQLYVEPVRLPRLYSFLKLDIVASVREFWDRARRQRDRLEAERVITLGSKEKCHIARFADFSSYRELLRWKEARS